MKKYFLFIALNLFAGFAMAHNNHVQSEKANSVDFAREYLQQLDSRTITYHIKVYDYTSNVPLSQILDLKDRKPAFNDGKSYNNLLNLLGENGTKNLIFNRMKSYTYSKPAIFSENKDNKQFNLILTPLLVSNGDEDSSMILSLKYFSESLIGFRHAKLPDGKTVVLPSNESFSSKQTLSGIKNGDRILFVLSGFSKGNRDHFFSQLAIVQVFF